MGMDVNVNGSNGNKNKVMGIETMTMGVNGHKNNDEQDKRELDEDRSKGNRSNVNRS